MLEAINAGLKEYWLKLVLAGIIFSTLEFLFPASKHSIVSRIRAIGFWAIYIAITTIALVLWSKFWNSVGLKPLFNLDLQGFASGFSLFNESVVAQITILFMLAIVSMYVGDFFYYWFHRFQHTSKYLWGFHRIHHSIVDLNALNCNHHFSEEIFRIPFVALPLSLLLNVSPGQTPVYVAVLLSMHGFFLHSSTRLGLGPLRYLLADNHFHRIHHSIQDGHHNKNFAAVLPVWDIMFGTALMPSRNSMWPACGLKELEEPTSVLHFFGGRSVKLREICKHIAVSGAACAVIFVLVKIASLAQLTIDDTKIKTISVGEVIDFGQSGNSAGLVGRGFSVQEESGRWVTTFGEINFKVDKAGVLVLRIEGTIINHPNALSQRVRFSINDQLIDQSVLHPDSSVLCFQIPERGRGETIRVRLETPDAISPSLLGIGNDNRSLSIFVKKITLLSASAGSCLI